MANSAKEIKKINDLLAKTNELTQKQKQAFENQVNALKATNAEAEDFQNLFQSVENTITQAARGAYEIRDALRASVDELSNAQKGALRAKNAFSGLESIANKLVYDQQAINRLTTDELKELQKKVKIKQDELKQAKQSLDSQISQLKNEDLLTEKGKKLLAAQKAVDEELALINSKKAGDVSLSEELIKQAQKRLEQEEKIAESMGLLPKLVKGLGSALSKLGIPDLGLSEAIEKATEDLRELDDKIKKLDPKGGVTSFQAMEAISSRVGENIAKQVTSANLFQLTMVAAIGAMKSLDKDSEALARNMNMSYREANAYRQELSVSSTLSGDLFVTSKGLAESSMAINEALGTSVKLNDENLKTFTKLRTTAGLTNDELLGAQKLVIGTNKSLEDATGEILAQAKFTSLNNGVLLNEKEILKDIKDVSAATTLSLGKNPAAIAEAVAQAKSLGMNLKQVENIAGQILDFESSIQNELEAELLLGKDINLEKAREAALNNDLATVASEIAKQAGTAAEFGEMNRIQQDALAKSVGMSRDDLAQTLFVQEQLVGLSGDQAKERQRLLDQRIQEVGLEQAMQEMEEDGIEGLEQQVGIATQFNAIIEKIQEAFVLVGTAVMPIVDMIAGMFGALAEMPAVIGLVAGALAGMKILSGIVAINSMIKAVAEIFGANAKFGPAGLVIATAVVGGMFAAIASAKSKAEKAGDLMSPAQGKTMVSTKEGGLFELSPNDDVVAAPGAADKMKSGGGNGALIAKVDQLIAVNRQILQKQYIIEMNGNQVGQEINQSERAVQ